MDKRKITIARGGNISVDRNGGGLSKRKITIGVVSILLVTGSLWAWMRSRPDAEVERVKQLQIEAFKPGATPEQRQMAWQEREKLSPEQRREVGQQGRQLMQRQMDQRIATYFSLPQAQRVAYLDQQIQEMEKRMKEMAARRGQGGGGQGRGGGQGGMGGRPGGGGGQAMNSDARALQRDQRLDGTTAQQRAMRSSFMADMAQRRAQLGLPPMGGRGGRPR